MLCFRKCIAATVCTAMGLLAALPQAAEAQARLRAEAFVGEPFGVGRLEVELPESLLSEPLGIGGLHVAEQDGRVLYPAIEQRGVPRVVTDLLGNARRPALRALGEVLDRPGRTNVYFLFLGRQPLKITLSSGASQTLSVVPAVHPASHRRLLGAWWKQYTAKPGFWQHRPDYPPLVENYLQSMLARRLGLSLPRKPKAENWMDMLSDELGLAAGTETVRLAYQRERFLAPTPAGEVASLPLPEPAAVAEAELPEVPADVKVEPLALHVPAECFYVRFGNFNHFLWFQDTLALWGGDLKNLVATRGLDTRMRERFENQLAVETTALARLLGGVVIADVAIVGTDMFLAEGGAYGLLFQARQTGMLAKDFQQQRRQRVKAVPGASEERHLIAGREVSLLTSPDGRLRSFYVADGDYHLIATSRTLVRRFLEVRDGKGSLGQLPEFRHARSLMPLSREDTVFLYASSEFFRNLTSPHYRIEMTRRMQAAADIELAEMARLASAAEKRPGATLENLAAGDFLPPGFGSRSDGSRVELVAGGFRDSLRGPRGYFIPVPDIEIKTASPAEIEMYRRFSEFYRSNWQRLDPVMAGIQRRSIGEGRERVTIDLRMSPLARQNYERLQRQLGEPDARRLAPIEGDSIAGEAVLRDQRIFGGVQFVALPLDAPEVPGPLGMIERLRRLVVGYVGTTGQAGPVSRFLPFVETAPADPAGYSAGRFGLWKRQTEQFIVFSFHRDLLETVTSQLRFEQAPRPAQVRVRAVDLSNARLTPFLNKLGYDRTRETSLGNLRLMHQMTEQLHVPGDQAKDVAERLFDARLIDPLGGQYVYRRPAGGAAFWTSTALESHRDRGPPSGYQAPPLNWFRGLLLDVLLEPAGLWAHVELDMQMPKKPDDRRAKPE
ncbi:MAG: hypothetical protein NUV77_00510 [Thermoguttaceae bacterium]|nr:hypothetical protein [Thermoguttaceae bacterium]